MRLPGHVLFNGADIAPSAIESAKAKHPNIHFMLLDVVTQVPPESDLVICRQCLNHMSSNDAITALRNIAASGCRWLLASHYPQGANDPAEATAAGVSYREYNLIAPPFDQSPLASKSPEALLEDEYDPERLKSGGNSMCLALWRLSPA